MQQSLQTVICRWCVGVEELRRWLRAHHRHSLHLPLSFEEPQVERREVKHLVNGGITQQ